MSLFKKLTFIGVLLLCYQNTGVAQVTGVDLQLKFDTTTCNYAVYMIVASGQATIPGHHIQANSTVTLVVPTGTSISVDQLYNPKIINTTNPLTWSQSEFLISPCAQPQHDFYSFIPDITSIGKYDHLNPNDTIKLFSININPFPTCGSEVRLWENGVDPPSHAPCMSGADFNNGFTIGSFIQLYQSNAPQGYPEGPDHNAEVLCKEGINIDLNADFPACTGPIDYTWTGPNGFSSNVEDVVRNTNNPSDGGTYTVTMLDAQGCTNTYSFNVEITPSAGMNRTTCAGGTISLEADYPSDGIWLEVSSNGPEVTLGSTVNGIADAIFDNNAMGDYYFYYEKGGCGDTISVTVNAKGDAPIISGDAMICEGDDINLSVPFVSGANYDWSGPNGFSSTLQEPTVLNATVLDDGQYSVVTTVNGCESNPGMFDVVVNESPISSASNDGPKCEGDDVQLNGGFVVGASYSWSGPNGFSSNDHSPMLDDVSVTDAGTYILIVSKNGCDSDPYITDVVINTMPSVDAGTYNSVCINNATINLLGSPNGGVFSGTGVLGSDFDPSVAGVGTHTITYSYTDGNGCTGTSTTNITVNDLPIIDAGVYPSTCIGEPSLNLVGSPNGGVFSGTGVLGSDFDPSVAGVGTHTITYTYTDALNCTNSSSTSIIVNDSPVVDAGSYGVQCEDGSLLSLVGSPNGGVFSGTGVSGSDFDPSVAGVGIHTITYSYTDGNGCSNSSTVDIEVSGLPIVDAGSYGVQCEDGSLLSLVGSPNGGVFSGTGVSGSDFDPSIAGVGIHTITYSYTDGNGCSNSSTVDIEVSGLPVVDAGSYGVQCEDGGLLSLVGSPNGGVFSGTGVSGSDFDPSIAGVGIHTITYSYTDGNGCSNSSTVDIEVSGLPVVEAGSYGVQCEDGGLLSLVGSPNGGVFSGTGVSGSDFDPSIAGVGIHTITYSYTDGNGCSNSSTVDIEVSGLPIVEAGSYGVQCEDGSLLSLVGSPSGGVFSGTGVSGSDFDPSIAGVGIHTITYSYTDGNGCSNSSTVDIEVSGLPIVDAGSYGVQCEDGSLLSLVGSPNGGVFSGTGVSGSDFDPSIAGVGIHTITYSYTDGNGCSNSSTVDIEVSGLPIVDAGSYGVQCEDGSLLSLVGSPNGGVFSGTGVSGSDFDPSIAGVGIHTITYSYTDGNGCSNSSTVDIEVSGLPIVDAGSYGVQCEDGGLLSLVGSPNGGVFSGTGVSGSDFDPSIAGVGIHTITYSYTDGNGCSNSSTVDIEVSGLPIVDAGSYGVQCEDGSLLSLVGSPNGGVFSGTGVSGSDFDPSIAGVGIHTITYSYTDGNGCSNSSTVDIEVSGLPIVDAGSYGVQCEDGSLLSLVGSPNGGVFSGTGVSGSDFDPSVSGVGIHTITYSYTDGNGCSNSSTVDIEVSGLPIVDAGSYGVQCEDGSLLSLVGSPNGGVFSGTGVSGSDFDPSIAGVGIHTITYSYTDGNGCSNSSTVDIEVSGLPIVDAGGYGVQCEDGSLLSLEGSPNGGVFSGTGVSGSDFDPSIAGVGIHTITYSYTDGNGCSNSSTVDIEVSGLPVVEAGSYGVQCEDGSLLSLVGSPNGGVFSGTGVSGSDFDPSIAGVGIHTITYSYTDGNGCSNSSTVDIEVSGLPIVDAGSYGVQCEDGSLLSLVGSPNGGVFSGTGVSGSDFDPSVSGVGIHTITYSYTDGNGCSNSSTVDIEVSGLPIVEAGSYGVQCEDGGLLSLVGSPSGGVFSGTGVSGSDFDPSIAGVGIHTITYSYTDGNGCSNSSTVDIEVSGLPIVDAGSYGVQCEDGSLLSLVGSPSGGVFSGTGVSGSDFDPSIAGVGIHTITYSYTDGNGCSNSSTVDIEVSGLPIVDAGSYGVQCEDGSLLSLVGSPNGGVFSGTGVSGSDFDPSVSGVGIHTITYSYTDGNGCSNSSTVDIEVSGLPIVDAGSYGVQCEDGSLLSLVGSPNGGVFSGTGVSGSDFDPSIAGVGIHTITYSYTDGNGCSNSSTVDIEVSGLPIVDAGSYDVQCEDGSLLSLVGSPNGGVFSGTGVSGSDFDPSIAGVGIHTITYSYTDGNGCSNSSTVDIEVSGLPIVDAGSYGVQCEDGSLLSLVGSPNGGVFSGTGVSGSDFDPSVSGVGIHTITYSYTDGNGCSNSSTVDIEVSGLPVVDAGSYDVQCEDGSLLSLVGSPNGGVFSGTGVSGSDFDPSIAGVGIHMITYSYTDGNGCSNSSTVDIEVSGLPIVDAGSYGVQCEDGSLLSLVGSPNGGVFSGTGVSGSDFDPSVSGVGIHTITYSYTDGNGCSNSSTVDIEVHEIPEFTVEQVECSVDLTTYSISFETTTQISTSSGTIVGNTITGIPANEDIMITVLTTSTDCDYIIDVSAPDCDCGVVSAPINPSNETICFGETVPSLSVTVEADQTVDWYDAPINGNLLIGSSTSYTPVASNPGLIMVYAESRSLIDNCTSATRTEVSLDVRDIPQITTVLVPEEICSGDEITTVNLESSIPGTTFSWELILPNDISTTHNTSGNGNIPNIEFVNNSTTSGVVICNIEPSLAQCSGDIVQYEITVHPNPELSILNVECSGDKTTYSIELTTNGTISVDHVSAVITGNVISNIPSGESVIITIEDGSTSCRYEETVVSPDCSCGIVTSPTGIGVEICEGDAGEPLEATVGANETVDWYASASGGISIQMGSLTYQPTETQAGVYTYYAEARNEIDGCVSSTRTAMTYEIHALPSMVIESKECSGDKTTYSIELTTNGTISVNHVSAVVTGNVISNIPSGEAVIITIEDGSTGCRYEETVVSPDCSCGIVTSPTGIGVEICEGDAGEPLEATVGVNETVDWYASASGGVSIQMGSLTYQPTETLAGVYTYYAEARNEIDGCVSSTRTAMTYEIHALPSMVIESKECSGDKTTYSIEFTTSGTISVDHVSAVVTGNVISNIPSGESVIITIEEGSTGCRYEETVVSPDCSCGIVTSPTGIGVEICEGDAGEPLEATVGANETVDWYASASGGVSIQMGSSTYQPTETQAGVYTYYAEARNEIDGCVSSTRTAMTYEIHALPSMVIESKECSGDKTTYSIELTTSGTISVNHVSAVVTGNVISNIPSGEAVIITIEDGSTGCRYEETVVSPDCSCGIVTNPTGIGVEICEGDAGEPLEAMVGLNETVDWYASASGGVSIQMGSSTYQPTETQAGVYTYYAEARNEIDGCVSSTRTAMTYEIHALPSMVIESKECSGDKTTYSIELTTSGTISVDHVSAVVTGNVISNIPSGESIIITIEDGSTGCRYEEAVVSPDCDCSVVLAPNGENEEICEGDMIPTLEVVVGSGESANWYNSANGNDLIISGTTTYKPDVNNPGEYKYFVEGINLSDQCVSSTRTEVLLIIHAKPSIVIEEKECSADLSTYSITYSGNAIVECSLGQVNGNTIAQIPAGESVFIKLTDSSTGCTSTIDVTSPDCSCGDLNAPVGDNAEICFGETIPELEVMVSNGQTANWFDAQQGGNLIVGNSITYRPMISTPGTYDYFVESVDINTTCVSEVRTQVRLVVKEVPTITNAILTEDICSGSSNSGFVLTSDFNNTQYSWTATSNNLTVPVSSGTGNIGQYVFNNDGNSSEDVIFNVTPEMDGCVGNPVQFTVTVLPEVEVGQSFYEVECIQSDTITLDGSGQGFWEIGQSNPGTFELSNTSSPNTSVYGFTEGGIYELYWVVGDCKTKVSILAHANCPCAISEVSIVEPFDSIYCERADDVLIVGEEALPQGGQYIWEYSIDNGPFIKLPNVNNEKNYLIKNFGPGWYELRRIYTLDDQFLCSDTSNVIDFFVFSIDQKPGPIMIDPDPVCEGDSIMLIIDKNPAIKYSWFINSGDGRLEMYADTAAMLFAESAGVIKIAVSQTLPGCNDDIQSALSEINVEIKQRPIPALGLDTTYCEDLGDQYFLDPGDFDSYLWQDGSTSRTYQVTEEGAYSVTVKDEDGCTGSDFIKIKSFCCEFLFPNIINANRSSLNNEFGLIDVYNCAIDSEIFIYDRWGNLVFKSDDGLAKWDGMFNGKPVEQGVYVFMFRYTALDENDQEFDDVISGDITVLR